MDAFAPSRERNNERLFLSRTIAAIQVMEADDGCDMLGLITQLGAGETIEVCGGGLNDKTAKVRMHSHTYFVFTQDMESLRASSVSR